MRSLRKLSLLALSVLVVACTNVSPDEEKASKANAQEAEAAKKQAQINEVTNEFAEKFNADLTWRESIEVGYFVSTVQLQRSLIRSDDRPILALGNLIDIEQSDDKFRFLFHVPGLSLRTYPQQHLVLDLKCSFQESELKALKVDRSSVWRDPDYIVAAKVQAVRQAHQFLQTVSEPPSDGILKMEFIAEGKCIAFQRIDRNEAHTASAVKMRK